MVDNFNVLKFDPITGKINTWQKSQIKRQY